MPHWWSDPALAPRPRTTFNLLALREKRGRMQIRYENTGEDDLAFHEHHLEK